MKEFNLPLPSLIQSVSGDAELPIPGSRVLSEHAPASGVGRISQRLGHTSQPSAIATSSHFHNHDDGKIHFNSIQNLDRQSNLLQELKWSIYFFSAITFIRIRIIYS